MRGRATRRQVNDRVHPDRSMFSAKQDSDSASPTIEKQPAHRRLYVPRRDWEPEQTSDRHDAEESRGEDDVRRMRCGNRDRTRHATIVDGATSNATPPHADMNAPSGPYKPTTDVAARSARTREKRGQIS